MKNASAEVDGYEVGLAALQFFASAEPAQVESWHRVDQQAVPWFFREHGEQDRAACYFYGIACIFMTYAGFVYDRYGNTHGNPDTMDFGSLTDFHNLLRVHTCTDDAAKWSQAASLEERNEMWDGLRQCAQGAIKELGEVVPDVVPTFIIDTLINPDEFRTSEDVVMP